MPGLRPRLTAWWPLTPLTPFDWDMKVSGRGRGDTFLGLELNSNSGSCVAVPDLYFGAGKLEAEKHVRSADPSLSPAGPPGRVAPAPPRHLLRFAFLLPTLRHVTGWFVSGSNRKAHTLLEGCSLLVRLGRRCRGLVRLKLRIDGLVTFRAFEAARDLEEIDFRSF